jgi:hypothetical protein
MMDQQRLDFGEDFWQSKNDNSNSKNRDSHQNSKFKNTDSTSNTSSYNVNWGKKKQILLNKNLNLVVIKNKKVVMSLIIFGMV